MNIPQIALSFDDGRLDTYYIFKEILMRKGIPATINIPAGYIESRFNDYRDIGYNGLMSKKQLDEIADNPLFEIAGHGYMHNNKISEIKKGLDLLREWYPQQKIIGFASPHSELTKAFVCENMDIFRNMGLEYVRGGRNITTKSIKRVLSGLARKTESVSLYRLAYNSSINQWKDFFLYAVPVMRFTTIDQIKDIIQLTISKKGKLVLEIHSIDKADSPEYQDIFCWEISKFLSVCEYMDHLRRRNIIEICKCSDF